MKTQTKTFELEAEKKHSVRYREVEDGNPSISSTIYFSKELLGQGVPYPSKINVTVEFEK